MICQEDILMESKKCQQAIIGYSICFCLWNTYLQQFFFFLSKLSSEHKVSLEKIGVLLNMSEKFLISLTCFFCWLKRVWLVYVADQQVVLQLSCDLHGGLTSKVFRFQTSQFVHHICNAVSEERGIPEHVFSQSSKSTLHKMKILSHYLESTDVVKNKFLTTLSLRRDKNMSCIIHFSPHCSLINPDEASTP